MQFQNLSDIIQGALRGNASAQQAMYNSYKGYCLKIIFRYIFNYEKAVDILHDGFVKVFHNLSSFKTADGPEEEWLFAGWIKRIMINTAIDALKKGRHDLAVSDISDDIWEIPDHNESADKLILYKDLILTIARLPPVYRIVFNMHVIDGISQQEISILLGIPVNTIKSKILRAKSILKNIIQEDLFWYA